MDIVFKGCNRLIDSWIGRMGAKAYLQARYFISPNETSVRVGPAEATFLARNQGQVSRIKNILKKEQGTIEHLLSNIKPTDTFWDVGADFGFYTCLLADLIDDNQLVAFEPYQPRVARLNINLRYNDVECEVISRALAGRDKKLTGYVNTFGRATPKTAVGDRLISEGHLPKPDVIKIDVDGGEWDVLDGLRDTLQKHTNLVYCEVHPNHLPSFGHDHIDVEQLLAENGFSVKRLHDRPGKTGAYYLLAQR